MSWDAPGWLRWSSLCRPWIHSSTPTGTSTPRNITWPKCTSPRPVEPSLLVLGPLVAERTPLVSPRRNHRAKELLASPLLRLHGRSQSTHCSRSQQRGRRHPQAVAQAVAVQGSQLTGVAHADSQHCQALAAGHLDVAVEWQCRPRFLSPERPSAARKLNTRNGSHRPANLRVCAQTLVAQESDGPRSLTLEAGERHGIVVGRAGSRAHCSGRWR
jgi:hypothetical protein